MSDAKIDEKYIDVLRKNPTGASRHMCIINVPESGQSDE
jgi:hypothetical protein